MGFGSPGGEMGVQMIIVYFQSHQIVMGIVALIDRLFWLVALFFWSVQYRTAYLIYRFQSEEVHKKLNTNNQSTELTSIQTTQNARPLPPRGVQTTIAGQQVNASISPDAAAAIASKAYSSGAARQLASGTKPTIDKNGNVSLQIDQKAGMQALTTLHNSGATKDLAGGLTLSLGGGDVVMAIHDFKSGEQGDLGLKVGDRITVLRGIDENWLEGRRANGEVGIFPKKFVSKA